MSDQRREPAISDENGVLSFGGIATRIWRTMRSDHVLAQLPLAIIAVVLIAVAWVLALLWNVLAFRYWWQYMFLDRLYEGPSDKTHPPSPAESHREARRQIGGF